MQGTRETKKRKGQGDTGGRKKVSGGDQNDIIIKNKRYNEYYVQMENEQHLRLE